jgi:hypothetical protein
MARNSSQSGRAKRSSTESPEAYAKGKVQLSTTRPAEVPGKGSRLRMEDINSRAHRPRGK